MKLVYTDDAMEELQRLREFIATHNPLAAAWAASELVSQIGLLPGFPELGSPLKWRRCRIPHCTRRFNPVAANIFVEISSIERSVTLREGMP